MPTKSHLVAHSGLSLSFHSNSTKHHINYDNIEQRPVLLPSHRSFDSKTTDSWFFVALLPITGAALYPVEKMLPFPTEFYLHLRLFDFSRLKPV